MKKRAKILVTAGPTQVKIDRVRVLSNVSTGKTGFLVAKQLCRSFDVTLLLGRSGVVCKENRYFKVKRFTYFKELRELLKKELKNKSYKAVVHTAAVSDFMPQRSYKGKLSSKKENVVLKLKPAPKIIREIKKADRNVFLIQFKLEVDKSDSVLFKKGYNSLRENNSDFVVVNDLKNVIEKKYRGFGIDRMKNKFKIKSRKELAELLKTKIKEEELKS